MNPEKLLMRFASLVPLLLWVSFLKAVEVRFTYSGGDKITGVAVAGDFNNWDFRNTPMIKLNDSTWALTIDLKPGVYHYRFIINGEKWVKDPRNPLYDGPRSNSLLFVYQKRYPMVKEILPKSGDVLKKENFPVKIKFDSEAVRSIRGGTLIIDGKSRLLEWESDTTLCGKLHLAPGHYPWKLKFDLLDKVPYPVYSGLWTVDTSAVIHAEANAGYVIVVSPGDTALADGGLTKFNLWHPAGSFYWQSRDTSLKITENRKTPYPSIVCQSGGASLIRLKTVDSIDSTLVLSLRKNRRFIRLSYAVKELERMAGEISTLYLAGDFNGWRVSDDWRFKFSADSFRIEHPVFPGEYEYKLVVNGEKWLTDPFNKHRIEDGWEGYNSIYSTGLRKEYVPPVTYEAGKLTALDDIVIYGDRNRMGKYRLKKFALSGGEVFVYDSPYPSLLAITWREKSTREEIFYPLIVNNQRIVPLEQTPAWADTAIIYEIFIRNFSGNGRGTFEDVRRKIPYLKYLGINTVWFMPVYEGPTEHGYAPTDFFAVESDYGTLKGFSDLIDALHRDGIRVIFDFVANHTSDQHPFFRASNNPRSYFRDWYYRFADGGYRYNADWDVLPDLRWENPNVRAYMLEVAKFWMARGVDGFRCDAAWGVPHSFWKSLRKELKIFNTEFLLIDEVLPRHPSFHDFEFDASYDTDFYGNLLDLFNGRKSLKGFVYGVKKTKFNYPGETIDLRYIENHDMPRMIKQFGKERAMLAGALLLLSPGMPLIYYGQEIGMKETRPLMDWSAVKNENEFIGLYRELINFRKNIELGAKDKDVIYTVVNDNLLKIENSRYLAVFNFDDSPKIIDGFHKKPLLGRNYESRSDGEIVLKKYGFIARNKK